MILNNILEELPEVPTFTTFTLRDINPLSGQRKIRTITAAGNKSMALLQKRFMKNLRQLRVPMEHATGGIPGSDALKNVKAHIRHDPERGCYLPCHIVTTDMASAYSNTKVTAIALVLAELDPEISYDQILNFLQQYCTDASGGLLIGLASCPDLFNIFCAVRIDPYLHEWCAKHDIVYTRYLDDLTFSSDTNPIGKKRRNYIRSVVAKAGLHLSDHKTHVYDLGKKSKRRSVIINGIGVNRRGRCFLPGHALEVIEEALPKAIAESLSQTELSQLHGRMGLFRQISRGRPLSERESAIFLQYRKIQQRTKNRRRERRRNRKK